MALLRVVTAPCTHFCCFAVPSIIAEISGRQTVAEGGNVTLKCIANGKPKPAIT